MELLFASIPITPINATIVFIVVVGDVSFKSA
jgi:hypothetical protein